LTITGGAVTDTIVLGGDGTSTPKSFPALTVTGNTSINSGLGANDSLLLDPGVTLKGNLAVLSANTFTMAAGSSVLGNASIYGGYAATTTLWAGNVGKELTVLGANTPNRLTVASSASINSLLPTLGTATTP